MACATLCLQFLTSIICLPISIALVKIGLYYYIPELSQELVDTDAFCTDRNITTVNKNASKHRLKVAYFSYLSKKKKR
jgi:hypothetical protein